MGRTDCKDRSENVAPGGAKTYRCLERLCPDGVGCVVLRSAFLKAAPITHIGKYADHDLNFYHWLKSQNQKLLNDWTCEAEHLETVGCTDQPSKLRAENS
ncbi:MAG TPA: hypothetical protein VLA12_21730 [Planctomycetaceae bacterium]|nr:hypothetical protein [Planctomycetaceae bacterium]